MKQKIFPYVLAGFIVLGFFALLFTLTYTDVPKENKDLVNMLIGALLTAFATVIAYYFGSSSGSAKKDDTINNAMNGKDIKN